MLLSNPKITSPRFTYPRFSDMLRPCLGVPPSPTPVTPFSTGSVRARVAEIDLLIATPDFLTPVMVCRSLRPRELLEPAVKPKCVPYGYGCEGGEAWRLATCSCPSPLLLDTLGLGRAWSNTDVGVLPEGLSRAGLGEP